MSRSETIRPYETRDCAGVAALYDAARPLGMAAPDAAADDACWFVVEGKAGQIVGYGAASGQETSRLVLVVHPDHQRRGRGGRLWASLWRELTARGTAAVQPWVRQENAAGVAWLQRHGFTQINPDGPVQFLLAGMDWGPLEAALSAVTAQGITLTTLAEEKERDPECLIKLHELHTTVEADVPGNDPATAPSPESYVKEWGQPGKLLFLAKDGARYVGLSTAAPRGADPFFEEHHDIFQQHLTGVRREYRQRGIATALKLLVIAHAKREGYHTLWTNSDNPAMRALNWKLGFRTGPWLVYRKTIEEAEL